MKRRRNSTSKRRLDEFSHLQISYSGPSFSDLPNNILITILLSLSIKSIFLCKCVCKTWYDLISDPDFAKLHFHQAQVYPLLRPMGFSSLSRMLYLVQSDEFEMCYDSSPVKIKVDCKLKLPLRNIEMIPDQEGVEGKNCMKLNMKKHKYKIVNSCNGLLCLSNPSDNEPVIVCNPVTGEFINLPEVRTFNNDPRPRIVCGLSFSPATNQYKVIRMFTGRRSEQNSVMVAEIHTLGTETWRVLPFLPDSTDVSFPATYFNGCVYWSLYSQNVLSFDIEKECFESISIPPLNGKSMGALGGELFISGSLFRSLQADHYVWAMKDNGVTKTWSQFFSSQNNDDDKLRCGSYQPIKYLNNGALLMFHSYNNALLCKDPRKTGFRYLKVHGFRALIEVIAHIPSFIPLKHALSGSNVKVFNVKSSRCAKLKLHREEQVISIVEENRKIKSDSKDMDQDFDSE